MVTELKDENLFLVKCSEWSATVSSTDHDEACTAVLSYMMDKYGNNLKLSCVMVSSNINEISDSPDPDEAVVYHPTSKILANAGYHNMSKAMKEIFDT